MWWIILGGLALVLTYFRLLRPFKYWKDQGVKQTNPTLIVGDHGGFLRQTISLAEFAEKVYNEAPNARYFGFYQFSHPTLALRDPDLIKQITVKDFDHFVDHRNFISEEADPLWSNNLFALQGQKWREMRATLSPAFTSSKMKFMFALIVKNGDRIAKYFLEKHQDLVEVEMKDVATRFATDVIANTSFGVEIDSLADRDNEFYKMGKEVTDFSSFTAIVKTFFFLLAPGMMSFLKIGLFSRKVNDFFNTLVKRNVESREKNGIVRPDMIQLLLEAKKNGLKHEESLPEVDTGFATVQESEVGKNLKHRMREVTQQDMVSQAMIFFFAGFDTVSNMMCFIAYELAVNPEIQERLMQEVDETWKSCNENCTYEALLKMKYMDMVVSEALRKWPIAAAVDRACTKPYTIEPKYPDEKPVHLKVNDLTWLPIFAIHRDPKYYQNPDKFDPERFSDQNKDNIKPYTYIPFGSGPRNCIGSRFALLETKVLFFYLLKHFQIVPTAKTQIPVVISKGFNLSSDDGFVLGLKRR